MAQWLICPYWVSEHGTLEDDSGRTHQADYQITEVHVTNPGDAEGRLDLVFYEARGDGNFYRSDWASGSWSAPPKYQRHYRPDPSLVYGDSFFAYGWFEMWMEPELNGDRCGGLEDHPESGGRASGKRIAADGAAGDEARRYRLPELFGRPQSPFTFPGGTVSGGGDGTVVTPWRP